MKYSTFKSLYKIAAESDKAHTPSEADMRWAKDILSWTYTPPTDAEIDEGWDAYWNKVNQEAEAKNRAVKENNRWWRTFLPFTDYNDYSDYSVKGSPSQVKAAWRHGKRKKHKDAYDAEVRKAKAILAAEEKAKMVAGAQNQGTGTLEQGRKSPVSLASQLAARDTGRFESPELAHLNDPANIWSYRRLGSQDPKYIAPEGYSSWSDEDWYIKGPYKAMDAFLVPGSNASLIYKSLHKKFNDAHKRDIDADGYVDGKIGNKPVQLNLNELEMNHLMKLREQRKRGDKRAADLLRFLQFADNGYGEGDYASTGEEVWNA